MNITILGGTTKRLLTAGKYCPSDILVTAEGNSSRLPEGYTELEYIQSTGTQYIDTGFKPNNNTRVDMKAAVVNTASTSVMFGTRHAANSTMFYLLVGNGAVKSYYNTSSSVSFGITAYAKNDISMAKEKLTVNGESGSYTNATFQCNYSMPLFALRTADTVHYYSSIKLYECQIYDNDVLVRDYIPCRNPYGVVGLYDLVNGQFYGNAGTGAFIGNVPVVRPSLPEGYTELEYIQSSGTQYINTGFIPTGENMRVVLDFMYTANHGSTSLYGTQKGTSSLQFAITAYSNPMFFVGTSQSLLSQTTTLNTRYVLDALANSGTLSVSLNGATKTATYSGSLEKTLPLSLLGNNINGATSQLVSAIVYSCQIYDNDTLVRDYVPCKRNSGGVVGLYDMVGAKFYGNAGSGSFTGA